MGFIDGGPAVIALAPATAARLEALADRLDEEALGRLPFVSGELAEALAQSNAVRGLVRGRAGLAVDWEEMNALAEEALSRPPLSEEDARAAAVAFLLDESFGDPPSRPAPRTEYELASGVYREPRPEEDA